MPAGATAKPNDDPGARRSNAASSVATSQDRPPFAWQDGRRLWILDGGPTSWILAELLFEPATCCYVEVRRASYRWPREAAGALLGRTFAAGQKRAEDAARELNAWVARSQPIT
jgi:hypothetical protein